MKVLQFKKPEPEVPHMSGAAFCLACDKQWQAVAEPGTTSLECPGCKCHKGRFKFECVPGVETVVRQCNCGNKLFYLTQDGHMCANCGTHQAY